jgi:Domain of unknown function (DUF5668)
LTEGRANRRALAFGVFFMAMGVVFLLDQLDVLRLDLGYVLPVVLIAVGLGLLLGARRRSAEAPLPTPSRPDTEVQHVHDEPGMPADGHADPEADRPV